MQPTIWNDERITAYALGELSADESSKLEAEMQANAELARAVDEAKQLTQQLSSLFANEPPMLLDAGKRETILAAPVVAIASNEAAKLGKSRFGALRVLSLAATVLLVGTLGTIVYRADFAKRQISTQVAMSSKLASPPEPSSPTADAHDNASIPMAVDNPMPKRREMERLDTAEMQLSEAKTEVVQEKSVPMSAEQAIADFNFAKEYGSKGMGMNELSLPASNLPTDAISAAPPSIGGEGRFRANANGYGDRMGIDMDDMEGMSSDSLSRDSFAMGMESSFAGNELSEEVVGLAKQEEKDTSRELSTDLKSRNRESLSRMLSIAPEGAGPGTAGDRFEPIVENGFRRVSEEPLSTFSIDVDTASYSKVRQYLMQAGSLPPAGAVRIEELVNYFDYQYEPPDENSEHPFVTRVEIADCPWTPGHRLARVAIKGKVIATEKRPASNLVFLVDTSGSMSEPNKLPLVKDGLRKLTKRLGENDRIALVVYAGSAGLVLPSTPATDQSTIMRKLNQLQSGGSTNGGEGIQLAYQVARDHFIDGGVNRVILCSDGDFNVGTTSTDELVTLVEKEAKGGIDITVLGFGMGNHNDSMMEQVSGRGNGNYAFIDTESEATRVLVEQTSSTLVTIARDVKIQVEFNPAEVAAYRLIGYENRVLANEDFKDDTKDAGEIGAGHSVTALYELIPAGGDTNVLPPAIDELRYQKSTPSAERKLDNELMNVKLRYKKPDSDVSTPIDFPVVDRAEGFDKATGDFRFAASVAGFGMLLRSSEHIGNWTLTDVEKVASQAKGSDQYGYRAEFVEMVRKASKLRSQER